GISPDHRRRIRGKAVGTYGPREFSRPAGRSRHCCRGRRPGGPRCVPRKPAEGRTARPRAQGEQCVRVPLIAEDGVRRTAAESFYRARGERTHVRLVDEPKLPTTNG